MTILKTIGIIIAVLVVAFFLLAIYSSCVIAGEVDNKHKR